MASRPETDGLRREQRHRETTVTTKRVTIAVVSMAAVLATLGAFNTAEAVPQDRVSTLQVAADKDRADRDAKVRFRPKKGVSFNVPGSQEINGKVLRAIRHTPRHSKIRAMTWNFNSWVFVNALRAAHNRGVSVRIIMARTLANEQGPNAPLPVATTTAAVPSSRAGSAPAPTPAGAPAVPCTASSTCSPRWAGPSAW
jgi:hypothetical protein